MYKDSGCASTRVLHDMREGVRIRALRLRMRFLLDALRTTALRFV